MKFKYSAFTENTPEMREWLEKLGYSMLVNHELDDYIFAHSDSNEAIGGCYIPDYENMVYCLGNPSLFQAVTAIREESDCMQWFTDGKDWIQWVGGIDDVTLAHHNYDCDLKDYHKATLSDLIAHF